MIDSSRVPGLSSCGAQASLPCGTWNLSSLTRDQTYVPWIGRQTPNHWTTREVLWFLLYIFSCRSFPLVFRSFSLIICSVNSCNFGVPGWEGEFRVFLLHHPGHSLNCVTHHYSISPYPIIWIYTIIYKANHSGLDIWKLCRVLSLW